MVAAVAVVSAAGQAGAPQPSRGSGILAGRVVDAAGDPVEGAIVSVRLDATGGPPVPAPTAGRAIPVRTNAEGRFVFTEVPAGGYQVDATKAGWLPGAFGRTRPGGSALPVVLADGAVRNDLTISVWRPAVIAGFVTADNGDPLIGVEVRAVQLLHIAGRRQMNMPQRPQTIARQKTDDRGAYRFSDLVPGEYVIAVLASVLSEPPGFTGAIRAQGSTPRSYYQTMTNTGAAPIVLERATGVAAGGRALVNSLTDLSGVPATEAAWPTYPTTYHPSATTLTTATIVPARSGEPQTAIDVNVRMVPTFQVSGTLTGPEGPAPWHGVHLVPADTGDTPLVDVSTAVTDADGAFTFYGVPPGQYIARVIRVPWPSGLEMGIAGGTGAIPYVTMFGRGPSAGPPSAPTEALLHASQPVVVEDRHIRNLSLTLTEGLRVRGRVIVDSTAAAPAADAWRTANISLVAAGGREDNALMPYPLTGEGPFTTSNMWPGKYLLRITPPRGLTVASASYQGRDLSVTAFDLTSDIENVVITLTNRVRTVKGTVQVESGAQQSDAVVLMFPTDQEAWLDYGRVNRRVASTRAAEDGTFRLVAPSDGEYYIVAIPDAESDDWQNPETLARLGGMADRFRMQGADVPSLSLRMRRIR
jgi:protocatechuate 3,4-dioxygenase beta subunit